MRAENKSTLLAMLREHDGLNGLRFVVVEFVLVTVASLLISLSGILHDRILAAIFGIGIAANAVAVIAIAVAQIRNHDENEGLLKLHSIQFRVRVSQEHPKLGTHTLIVLVSVLMPFLLVALLYLRRIGRSPAKPV